MGIGKPLKNANVLQLGMSKNPTTALYSEITKAEFFTDKTKTIKKAKITKWVHASKNYAHTYIAKILNSLNRRNYRNGTMIIP